MRFVWSLALVFIALMASQTPAAATINRVADAMAMSGSCDGSANRYAEGEYDQAIRTVTGELLSAVQGDPGVNAGMIATYSAAAAQLYRCKLQRQFWDLIMRAHLRCSMLKSSLDQVMGLLQLQQQVTGGVTEPYVQAVLSNFQTAVKRCWAELAARCINMNDRLAVARAADLLRAADRVRLPRSELQPPLRACTETIPWCRPGEAEETCLPYLRDLSEILLGEFLPPAIDGRVEAGAP
jgi:hypothetical protein